MNNEVISKAEAARRWGVSKAAITKYVHKGMPVLSDGKLDWAVASKWRKMYCGFEPIAPKMAREEARARREKPVNEGADDDVTLANQVGRWDALRALVGPAAMARTMKVLLELGFTPKHAVQAAFWFYMSPAECIDITEEDLNGPGEIFEPDWKTLLPAGKPFNVEQAMERVEAAMAELFSVIP